MKNLQALNVVKNSLIVLTRFRRETQSKRSPAATPKAPALNPASPAAFADVTFPEVDAGVDAGVEDSFSDVETLSEVGVLSNFG